MSEKSKSEMKRLVALGAIPEASVKSDLPSETGNSITQDAAPNGNNLHYRQDDAENRQCPAIQTYGAEIDNANLRMTKREPTTEKSGLCICGHSKHGSLPIDRPDYCEHRFHSVDGIIQCERCCTLLESIPKVECKETFSENNVQKHLLEGYENAEPEFPDDKGGK